MTPKGNWAIAPGAAIAERIAEQRKKIIKDKLVAEPFESFTKTFEWLRHGQNEKIFY